MRRRDLIDAVMDRAQVPEWTAQEAVDATLHTIASALHRGETVQLTGFGTFRTAERAARTMRHPRTGEPMQAPATRTVTFRAGQRLREAVDGTATKKDEPH